jgi:hypothetical protein
MSKKSVGPFIRDMIHENKFDIVCFQETILKDFPDSCLRKIDPGSCYLWDWILAKGRSGGVFTGIKVDRFDVGNRVQGSFILQHNLWDRRLETKWNVMNVYGAAQEENKDSFLSELASFCSRSQEPYLIGVDFNIVRFSHEKNRNFTPNRFTDMFNVVISLNELREIYISGGGGLLGLIIRRLLLLRNWTKFLCQVDGSRCSPLSKCLKNQENYVIITFWWCLPNNWALEK